MKIIAIAAGALLAALATGASAQYYSYGGRYVQGNQECWNPHAGHFEQVRPGEVQNDLDFSRCRYSGSAYAEPLQAPPVYAAPGGSGPAYAPGYGWYDRGANPYERGANPYDRGLSANDECWNPHAGHFERVRPGDRQDDLDFSRCRPAGYAYRYR